MIWDFPELLLGHERDLETLLRILRDVAEEWSRPVSEGNYWDRGSIPFRILLQAEPGGETAMSERLAAMGMTAAPWKLPEWVKAWIARAEGVRDS